MASWRRGVYRYLISIGARRAGLDDGAGARRVVGDDAVDTHGHQRLQRLRLVDGPDVHQIAERLPAPHRRRGTEGRLRVERARAQPAGRPGRAQRKRGRSLEQQPGRDLRRAAHPRPDRARMKRRHQHARGAAGPRDDRRDPIDQRPDRTAAVTAGLDLDVHQQVGAGRLQRLFERGDARARRQRQRAQLRQRQVGDPVGAARQARGIVIVKDNHLAGRTAEHVELDAVGAVPRGPRERGGAVLRFERARPAVADDQRPLRVTARPHNEKRTTGGPRN